MQKIKVIFCGNILNFVNEIAARLAHAKIQSQLRGNQFFHSFYTVTRWDWVGMTQGLAQRSFGDEISLGREEPEGTDPFAFLWSALWFQILREVYQ